MTTIYAALDDRLLVCEGTPGGDWSATVRLRGRHLECVAASSDAPERAVVGTFEAGLFRTRDGGATVDALETPFASEAVTAVAISPHDPDVIYAGTEPSRVYRSVDGGDAWEPLEGLVDLPSADRWSFPPRPHTHHVRRIEVDPFDPERLYVGIEAGAFVYTDDGGETWHDRPPGSRRDNHALATHPDREGRVYAAAGDGYAESDDGGETWRHPQEGLEHTYCWGLARDPADPDAVLVSSAHGAARAHRADAADTYVYRRSAPGGEDSRGAAWERLDDRGLPTGDGVVRAVFDTVGKPGVVYALHNRGLFVTEDFGGRWDRLPIEWPAELERDTPRGLAVVP